MMEGQRPVCTHHWDIGEENAKGISHQKCRLCGEEQWTDEQGNLYDKDGTCLGDRIQSGEGAHTVIKRLNKRKRWHKGELDNTYGTEIKELLDKGFTPRQISDIIYAGAKDEVDTGSIYSMMQVKGWHREPIKRTVEDVKAICGVIRKTDKQVSRAVKSALATEPSAASPGNQAVQPSRDTKAPPTVREAKAHVVQVSTELADRIYCPKCGTKIMIKLTIIEGG